MTVWLEGLMLQRNEEIELAEKQWNSDDAFGVMSGCQTMLLEM